MKRFLITFTILWSLCFSAYSQATGFADLKFGSAQLSDTQWDVGACMYTNTCNIYGLSGIGVTWNLGYPVSVGATQYIAFTASGDANNPWNMKLYNSDGTVAQDLGLGRLAIQGADSAGHHFFFFTNDNWNGTVFSIDYGFPNSNGFSFTGTGSPTVSQTDTFAATYGSTTPLAPGETYTGGGGSAPAGPTVAGGTITTTNWSGNEVITSGSSSTAGYTGSQQTRVDTWTNGSQSYNNILYIEQTYGSNNNVTITQSGTKNRIDFTLNGNGNVVSTTQTGSNYLKEEIPGWGNNIVINQSNTVTTNYAETKIQGNGNTVNHTQTGPGNHVMFNTSAGDINTINVSQSGTAGHYAESKLTGNFNNVKIDQSGNTQNKANIDLTNSGGAASLDLQQTGGKNFTIIQNCLNPAGCGTVVRQ